MIGTPKAFLSTVPQLLCGVYLFITTIVVNANCAVSASVNAGNSGIAVKAIRSGMMISEVSILTLIPSVRDDSSNVVDLGIRNISSDSVDMCSQEDVVKLAKEQAEEQIGTVFSAVNAFGAIIQQKQNQIVASVELSEFREYQAFDNAIKKRFCEASALIKISGINDMTKMGLVLNGINPEILSNGVDDTIRYSIQLTEDGTQLVGLEGDSNLLNSAE